MKSLDKEELQILLLCFSKPKVLEALRIYNKIPGHGKQAFFNAGKRELNRRGWQKRIPLLTSYGFEDDK